MTEALVALLVSPKWILQKIQINGILMVHIIHCIMPTLIFYINFLYTSIILFDVGLSFLFQSEQTLKWVYCLCRQFHRNDCILQLKHEFASFVQQ